jgi:hypothetical protein
MAVTQVVDQSLELDVRIPSQGQLLPASAQLARASARNRPRAVANSTKYGSEPRRAQSEAMLVLVGLDTKPRAVSQLRESRSPGPTTG